MAQEVNSSLKRIVFSDELQNYIDRCELARTDIYVEVNGQRVVLDTIYNFKTRFLKPGLKIEDIKIPKKEQSSLASAAAANPTSFTPSYNYLYNILVVGEDELAIQEFCLKSRTESSHTRKHSDGSVIKINVFALPGFFNPKAKPFSLPPEEHAHLLFIDLAKFDKVSLSKLIDSIDTKLLFLKKHPAQSMNIFVVLANNKPTIPDESMGIIHSYLDSLKSRGVIDAFVVNLNSSNQIYSLFEYIISNLITAGIQKAAAQQATAKRAASQFFASSVAAQGPADSSQPVMSIAQLAAGAGQGDQPLTVTSTVTNTRSTS